MRRRPIELAKPSDPDGVLSALSHEECVMLSIDKLYARLRVLESPVLLLLRLNIGVLFATTGWGKVHDLASVTGLFTELHIPFPAFNAVLVSYTELIGGSLLIIGLTTRLAALPLVATMLVAIVSAKAAEIGSVADLAATDELTYALLLLAIVVFGPGKLAADALIASRRRTTAGAHHVVPRVPSPATILSTPAGPHR